MVVIFLAPAAAETGRVQDRMATPSKWTVHAPHRDIPQPNFVPLSPTMSRMAQSKGIWGSTSSVYALLLMVKLIDDIKRNLITNMNQKRKPEAALFSDRQFNLLF